MNLPAGPQPLPAGPTAPPLLQILQAILWPLKSLEDAVARHGDVYTARLGGFGELVVVSNPQLIEQIMTTDPELFDSGRGNKTLAPVVGDTSMTLLDGPAHQRQRRLLMPSFHGERMKAYSELINSIAEQATDTWKPGQSITVRSVMQSISLQVIMRAVFGVAEGERYNLLQLRLSELTDIFNIPISASLLFITWLRQDWGPLSPWGHFVRLRQQIDELLLSEIRERRANPELLGEDILSLMLSARDEAGEPMGDEELRDELLTLLFAGHETTATAMAWALYWMHWHPEVGEKVLKELAELGEKPDPMAIVRLPYLNAVCQETLRIYPIALFTFSRIAKQPLQLLNYAIPKGTQLSICIYLTHHRPDLYPEPERFRPERFLERQFSPYEFIPFGGSNRRCLGAAFAQFEMKLVLAKIIQTWQLQLASDRPVLPTRRGVTLAPTGGVPMVVVGKR